MGVNPKVEADPIVDSKTTSDGDSKNDDNLTNTPSTVAVTDTGIINTTTIINNNDANSNATTNVADIEKTITETVITATTPETIVVTPIATNVLVTNNTTKDSVAINSEKSTVNAKVDNENITIFELSNTAATTTNNNIDHETDIKGVDVVKTDNHVYANVEIVVKPDIIFDDNDDDKNNKDGGAYTICPDHSDDEDGTPDDDDDHNNHHQHDDDEDDDDEDCGSSNNESAPSTIIASQNNSKDLCVEDFVFVDENVKGDNFPNQVDTSNNVNVPQIIKSTTADVNIRPIDVVRSENQRLSQTMVKNGVTSMLAATMTQSSTLSSPHGALMNVASSTPNAINGNTTMESRKRKAPTMSISLLQFIQLLFEIRTEMIIDVKTRKISFKRSIGSYVENFSAAKYLKFDKTNKNLDAENHTEQFNAKVYNCVINKLFIWFESQNATFLFPKEMLRYFLSTYIDFIKPVDFIDTNSIQKVDKRGKSIAQLMNGGILYEYAKGFDIFISSMSRSDIGDIQALKFIVEKSINIPSDAYELILNIKFTPKPHTQDLEYKHRENYSQIMITNNKQMFVLITKNIVMIYDGNMFIAPTTNTEREFTVSMRENSKLGDTDYILLDIMFAVKIRVIDVLQCNINGKTELPELYSERLEFIQRMVPNLRLATISQQKLTNDCSYIHKPNSGFGPSYIYYKSNLTAAAIGVVDKNVILAFHDRNEKTLVVKTKVSISGPVSYMIAIMPVFSTSDTPTILLDDIPMRIIGDIKDARIFKRVIPIELKDFNRLSIYSARPISDIADYKPNVVRKESAILDDMQKQLIQNPHLLAQLLMNFAATHVMIPEESRNIINNILDPKFDITFDGYNNLT
ncbi:GrBNV gp37-like protein-like protein [Mauternbach virus]|uniref:GrBNV gp37-like protein-like protein n=1 Tax=Mauternbach virus TaxID=2486603 RepID=A0A3G3E7Y4_9VIRU|nr:GrBNV gp37-like protein-like protein [Mauternbach virus]AYP97898.1 GrBNV gp37-like protein-like protein [Mauternbach virus]